MRPSTANVEGKGNLHKDSRSEAGGYISHNMYLPTIFTYHSSIILNSFSSLLFSKLICQQNLSRPSQDCGKVVCSLRATFTISQYMAVLKVKYYCNIYNEGVRFWSKSKKLLIVVKLISTYIRFLT